MESYQEKILGNMLNDMGTNLQYSNFEILSTIKDCFTISRIERELFELSGPAALNEAPRKEMEIKYDELDAILIKYPNAVKVTKEKEDDKGQK